MAPEPQKTIILVEDDLELAHLIRDRLEAEGYRVHHRANGLEARDLIRQEPPDLVILDLMLPGLDGFGVCRETRPAYRGPILILTARDDDMDHILGLELGADDFVNKPIRPRVLLARIRALLRRAEAVEAPVPKRRISIGDLTVDASRREATRGDRPIELTTIEFDLLWFLVRNAGRPVSRDELYQELYNTEYDGMDRAVDVYVSRLRHKLEGGESEPKLLKTVRGVGYLFADMAS